MRRKLVTALCAAFFLTSVPAALADDDDYDDDDRHRVHSQHYGYAAHDHGRHGHKHHGHKHHSQRHHGHKHHGHKHDRGHGHGVVEWHGTRHWNPPPRRVVHHHHHHHHARPHPVHRHGSGYRHRPQRDDWAIYAILALQLAEVLNSQQQQSFAWATQRAATVPLGDSIQWQETGAYGSVTPLRDGTDEGGRYCREFQHQIVVGNRQQSAYGVACRQPDGAWEIVSGAEAR